MESEDPNTVRKLHKAGREKLRRDRLNEQFIELENTLDGDRPKNDKATLLSDTIQLLKDLTVEVDKLKAEHAALTEESHELTQEKNDLKEEKGALKSEMERLNAQYQQRRGSNAYPWVAVDHSAFPLPSSYPYPVPFPVPPAPMHMHPSMQPYPFFGGPNSGIYPNPCSTFIPYVTPSAPLGQPSTQPGKTKDSNHIASELELKTPGSTTEEVVSSEEKKARKAQEKKNIPVESSSSSRCSSSPSIPEVSSNSIVGGGKADS